MIKIKWYYKNLIASRLYLMRSHSLVGVCIPQALVIHSHWSKLTSELWTRKALSIPKAADDKKKPGLELTKIQKGYFIEYI